MKTTFKINIGTNQAARNVDMWGELEAEIKQVQELLPEMEKKALNTGGFIIKDSLKKSLTEKWPASGRAFTVKTAKNPQAKGYYITKTDPISEGVRQSKSQGGKVTIYVGDGGANAPGYLAKMYEHDSKERTAKTYLGQKLKKPRKLGKLTGKKYFEPGITAKEDAAYDAMERIIFNRIEKIIDE